jgi:TatD DNase family protein
MYDLEKNYPEHVFLMMDHPTYVKELFRRIAAWEEELAKRKFYAVGKWN